LLLSADFNWASARLTNVGEHRPLGDLLNDEEIGDMGDTGDTGDMAGWELPLERCSNLLNFSVKSATSKLSLYFSLKSSTLLAFRNPPALSYGEPLGRK